MGDNRGDNGASIPPAMASLGNWWREAGDRALRKGLGLETAADRAYVAAREEKAYVARLQGIAEGYLDKDGSLIR